MLSALIIAHRGASIEEKENTLGAFQQEITLGADFVECDVHLTSDGVAVVRHDPLEMTRKEMVEKDPSIPELKQVLELVGNRAGVMVEIKHETASAEALVDEALRFVKEYQTDAVMGSFSLEVMRELEKQAPEMRRIALAETEEEIENHLKLKPDILGVFTDTLNEKLIQKLKAAGVEIWSWTVNCEKRAKELAEWGVRGIITDDPRKMTKIL